MGKWGNSYLVSSLHQQQISVLSIVSKYLELERESYDGVTKCNKTQPNFHEAQTVANLIQRMKRFLKLKLKPFS